MKLDAIFFDLDGTLLPMQQEAFTKAYLKELAKALAPFGIAPDALISAVWDGTKAMLQNDGQRRNADVFWACFERLTGESEARFRPICDRFYSEGFHLARNAAGENPLAREAVRLAHEKAGTVVLATNPLFPLVGQAARMSWIGLRPEDFDLVTSYETDSYCKPNPAYYLAICERMKVEPARCLMIGNDEREDMAAASSAGLQAYLVTDCQIPDAQHPWTGARGSFADMLSMLAAL